MSPIPIPVDVRAEETTYCVRYRTVDAGAGLVEASVAIEAVRTHGRFERATAPMSQTEIRRAFAQAG